MLDQAIECAKSGYSVLALSPNSKIPIKDSILQPNGSKSASKDPKHITELFTTYPKANLGVATGEMSMITVIDIDSVTFLSATRAQLTLNSSDVDEGDFISVIGTINIGPLSSVPRSKVLTDGTFTGELDSDNKLQLGFADGYTLTSILDYNSIDVTSKFKFDNGQRGNFYDHATAILQPGESVTGPLTATFKYFEHTGTGFLTVDSYDSTDVPYEDIPLYEDSSTGGVVELKNMIDFRPRRKNNDTEHYDTTSAPSDNEIKFPVPNTTSTS